MSSMQICVSGRSSKIVFHHLEFGNLIYFVPQIYILVQEGQIMSCHGTLSHRNVSVKVIISIKVEYAGYTMVEIYISKSTSASFRQSKNI